ncbi:uncharacterized protein AMSG_02365 [Thecamonas trahens ATCC 50062]|uniref:C2 domain-containing protein n=1 Tax=Thecamonas trahens ATCC 50062 TaxID=461836 RepID=A0A0L0DVZ9_THETB|nr:hypothetical protein AMSG_02365 [Thecamonas trahens ATCC 50062]KNC56395.1 hypothetical protein AMSG_02365 [Thecamonas trahens ATCC 50062]|eukprot:XP_013760909.1 hypothetical protein AMSG_02365 [Thecamonas trahens ATCC 50062]
MEDASQIDVGKLEVQVVEARDLMQADRWSQSDPYVVVTFADKWESTYTVSDSNNPVWKKQEPFFFEVRSRKAKIFVDVFDKNKMEKDVFLGQVEISLEELENGSKRDAWWSLKDRMAGVEGAQVGRAEGKEITGSIHLRIEYTYSRVSEVAAYFLNEEVDVYAVKGEKKAAEFSMSVLIGNITVLYGLLEPLINWYYRQWDYWMWKDASASFTMLLVYSFISLNNWLIPTLIPLYLLAYMSWNYIEVGGKLTSADDDDYTFAVQEGEQQVDMGFLGISYYKSQMQVIQNSIGDTNVWIQGNKDLFNWRYPATTKYVWIGVAILTVLWSIVPFRFVMFTITLYLFTRFTKFYVYSWRIYKGLYKIVEERYGREASVKRRGFEASTPKPVSSASPAPKTVSSPVASQTRQSPASSSARKSNKSHKSNKSASPSKRTRKALPLAPTASSASSAAVTPAPSTPASYATPAADSPAASSSAMADSPSSSRRRKVKKSKHKRKPRTPKE